MIRVCSRVALHAARSSELARSRRSVGESVSRRIGTEVMGGSSWGLGADGHLLLKSRGGVSWPLMSRPGGTWQTNDAGRCGPPLPVGARRPACSPSEVTAWAAMCRLCLDARARLAGSVLVLALLGGICSVLLLAHRGATAGRRGGRRPERGLCAGARRRGSGLAVDEPDALLRPAVIALDDRLVEAVVVRSAVVSLDADGR